MAEEKAKPKTIDEYIQTFPPEIQSILESFRVAILEVAPDVVETIAYQMPTFRLNKNLVHFAAHKNHIGFYPTPSAIDFFKDELAAYKTSKGAVQFPIDKPLPIDLIKRMVAFRVKELQGKR